MDDLVLNLAEKMEFSQDSQVVGKQVLMLGVELQALQWGSLKETAMVEWMDLSKVGQMDDCAAEMKGEILVVNSETMQGELVVNLVEEQV